MKRFIFSYTAGQLVPYINWNYFFHAWGIGTQAADSEKAQEIKRDACQLLDSIKERVVAKAVFALCDASGDGDNIVIEGTTLPLLRQQHSQAGRPNICLSDFVAPHGDKIGLFATTCDTKELTTDESDTYTRLLAQTTAARLAEAAATLLHRDVRCKEELWGYAPDEQLSPAELNAEKFRGIRPAVGYPSLPDQSVIFIIDSLLQTAEIGIGLTPNGAMHPHASVCGLMIHHPAAHYFAVGSISDEQLHDYAARRGIASADLHKFLYKNLHK